MDTNYFLRMILKESKKSRLSVACVASQVLFLMHISMSIYIYIYIFEGWFSSGHKVLNLIHEPHMSLKYQYSGDRSKGSRSPRPSSTIQKVHIQIKEKILYEKRYWRLMKMGCFQGCWNLERHLKFASMHSSMWLRMLLLNHV